jgi:D-inositol-3-phosphate glycosyltransferase
MSTSEPLASSLPAGAPGGAWPRRILVVARWYPSHDDPGSGSFVSDEVVALRAAGIDVVVASWENVDLRAREGGTDSVRGQALEAWARAVVEPAALSTPSAWGAGVPVARIPAVHPGGRLPARAAIEAHAALLVPFATALAARWPFDVVHAHVGIPDGAAAALVATALGVPLVVTEHASSAPGALEEEEEARLAYRELLGEGRRVVAVSRALASRLEAPLGLAAGSIPVVPNIIRFDHFTLGTEDRDPDELLWVGARRERKGMDVLLRAVALARERRPELHLRLIGRAPDVATAGRWLDLAEEVGLGDAVAFEPPADRAGVAAAMRRAAIFVHPSPFETFGMVAAEALASGLPVAARRSGGVEEVLAGQDVGAELADGDDAAALADAILRLRSRLAEIDPAAIRATVIDRFPATAAIAAILDHARDAAAELPPAGGRASSGASAAPPTTDGAPGTGRRAGSTHELGTRPEPPEPLPAVLVVGLRRAVAARRVAALPASLASRLTIVTSVERVEKVGALPPGARWIETDRDAAYARRRAALGGPPDPGRSAVERLVSACLHPRRTVLRRRLPRERSGMRSAAERDAVLAAWRDVAAGSLEGRAIVVAVGADDVVVVASALGARGALAPGGLRWLADAWDAAGRP